MQMNAPNELPKDRGLIKLVTTSLFSLGTPGSPSATTTIRWSAGH